MMDYRIHIAALDAFREQLALSIIEDPAVGALRDRHVADADQASEMALLGSLIDHLIWHAASDGQELALLQRASTLWKEGLTLYDTLASFRLQLETVLNDPGNVTALQDLNSASAKLQSLTQKVLTQDAEIKALKSDIVKMPHLLPHPRQMDRPLPDWTWADIFLARRTEAFVREASQQAHDTTTSAFAFGVLSSYGANASGSAYLGKWSVDRAAAIDTGAASLATRSAVGLRVTIPSYPLWLTWRNS